MLAERVIFLRQWMTCCFKRGSVSHEGAGQATRAVWSYFRLARCAVSITVVPSSHYKSEEWKNACEIVILRFKKKNCCRFKNLRLGHNFFFFFYEADHKNQLYQSSGCGASLQEVDGGRETMKWHHHYFPSALFGVSLLAPPTPSPARS